MKTATDKTLYGSKFFERNKIDSKRHSVDIVLTEALRFLPPIRSAVDFGCGLGTWLAGLQRLGATKVKGLDGPWVDPEQLVIDRQNFEAVDFDREVRLDKKYDLAISIEVGEHLMPASAEGFVKTITEAADIVLFSAAIPGQGGENHVNEQWPAYWNRLFNGFDFIAVDCLRKRLWDREGVVEFHSQNIMLYVRRSKQHEIKAPEGDFCIDYAPMPLVNHQRYLRMASRDISQMSLLEIFVNSWKWSVVRILGPKLSRKIYEKFK